MSGSEELAITIVVGMGGVVVLAIVLLIEGQRLGDRPTDATICAQLVHRPPDASPCVRVTIVNRSEHVVVVGLSLRRSRMLECLWGEPLVVKVPHRTHRPRYRPDRQMSVGVVEPNDQRTWILAVADATSTRALRATAVIGQSGRRLRMLDRIVDNEPRPEARSH